MRRGHKSFDLGSQTALILGGMVLAGAGLLLLTQFDTLRRYIGMRRMSARRHPMPPNVEMQSQETYPRWGTSHWPMH